MKRIVTFLLAAVLLLSCIPVPAQAASVGMAAIGASGYQTMTTSQKGIDMIKVMEGFYAEAYWDYSQWTIGYGSYAGSSTYSDKPTQTLTYAEAEELLKTQLREGYTTSSGQTVKGYEQYVNEYCKRIGKQPTQYQFDALVSFTYNVGSGWMGTTTAGSRVDAWLRNPTTEMDFINAIGVWAYAGDGYLYGLTQRRIREAIVFLRNEYSIPNSVSSDYNVNSGIEVISNGALPYVVSVVYECGEGAFADDGKSYRVSYFQKGGALGTLPRPSRDGYTFTGWKVTRKNGNKTTIGDIVYLDTIASYNMELTAQWVEGTNVTVENGDKISGSLPSTGTSDGSIGGSVNTGDIIVPVDGLPFTDISATAWYMDSVKYVYENGYMNGMTDTTFVPSGSLTRAMLVTVLYRMEGSPDMGGSGSGFSDVRDSEYYADAVTWARENGIVTGINENEFQPNSDLTRQQAVAIFYRYCVTYKKADGSNLASLDAFPDASSVAAYAVTAMRWAVSNRLITGSATTSGKTILDPKGTLSRSQCATLIQRCQEEILN